MGLFWLLNEREALLVPGEIFLPDVVPPGSPGNAGRSFKSNADAHSAVIDSCLCVLRTRNNVGRER